MSRTLSEDQSAALFDILTHYDTYAEIRDFRVPGSLKHYGPPFTHEEKKPSTAPALQTLVSRFLLTLPGLRDLPNDFWKVQCHDIIENFEKAELSESYDKGVVGSRKTLATAISALIEYPVRGTYGGFRHTEKIEQNYDLTKAEDLSRAFRDFVDKAIYADVLDELVAKAAETDQLSDHGPLTKAVHEFVLVNLASFMHYILILSPKGQYLLKLVENIHRLIPYVVVRQTLKIGNVASMMNAMVKIGLAKMSMASFTNWMGLTQTEDEGMNLMQQIISTVLNWDIKDLEVRAGKIEKDKNAPSKEQLVAIKKYQTLPRDKHEELRDLSQTSSISIVMAILANSSLPSDMKESTHKLALDYLSIQLSIRDRKEIIQVLCRAVPDHLTTAVRALVTAYEPVIRGMHNAIDLSDTVYDFEMFTRDLIKLAKVQPPGKDGKSFVPTVGDFVQLLKKHQFSCHKFVHQCCKNGKELTSWYLEWAKLAASHFHRAETSDSESTIPITHGAAGDMTATLEDLFTSLDDSTQANLIPVLDAQTSYLEQMHSSSSARLSEVLSSAPSKSPAIVRLLSYTGSSNNNNSNSGTQSRTQSRPQSRAGSRASSPGPGPGPSPISPTTPRSAIESLKSAAAIDPTTAEPASTAAAAAASDPSSQPPSITSDPGPGAYLSRWQDLLDRSPITPLTPHGEVKRASTKEIVQESAKDVDGTVLAKMEKVDISGNIKIVDGQGRVGTDTKHKDGKGKVERPDIRPVVEALAKKFRDVLAEKSCDW